MKWPYSLGERGKKSSKENICIQETHRGTNSRKWLEKSETWNQESPKGKCQGLPHSFNKNLGFSLTYGFDYRDDEILSSSCWIKERILWGKVNRSRDTFSVCSELSEQNLYWAKPLQYCCLGLLWRHVIVSSAAIFHKVFVFQYWFVCVPYVLDINLFLKYWADKYFPPNYRAIF